MAFPLDYIKFCIPGRVKDLPLMRCEASFTRPGIQNILCEEEKAQIFVRIFPINGKNLILFIHFTPPPKRKWNYVDKLYMLQGNFPRWEMGRGGKKFCPSANMLFIFALKISVFGG